MLTGTRAFPRRRRVRRAGVGARARAGLDAAACHAVARARDIPQTLSAEEPETTHRRRAGRAPGAGGRVRDGRAADDGSHVISVTRTAGVDGRIRRRRRRDASRSPFPRCGICAKRRHPRRPRRAWTSSRPPPTSPRRLRSRQTGGRSCSWPRVMARLVCGCGRWRRRRRSRWRAPRARASLLVTRQPIRRLLRRGRAEAARPRRRRAANPRAGQRRSRRDVERGRRHRVRRECDWRPLMRVSATGGAVTAVTTLGPQQRRPPRAAFSARRPPVPVLRAGRAGHGRDLPGHARRKRPDPADASDGRRYYPRAGRDASPRRVAAVGAGGHAPGPAAGRGAGSARRASR